jgi:hypothetical protein
MNLENFTTTFNVDKVKNLGHYFVTNQYERLTKMEFKHAIATGVEHFLEMKGLEKAKILGSCLLSFWLIYVGRSLLFQINSETDQLRSHSVSFTTFTSIHLRGILGRF